MTCLYSVPDTHQACVRVRVRVLSHDGVRSHLCESAVRVCVHTCAGRPKRRVLNAVALRHYVHHCGDPAKAGNRCGCSESDRKMKCLRDVRARDPAPHVPSVL